MQTDRFLVVDDQPEMGSFLQIVAESCGFEVVVASDRQSFKEAYWSFRPNLIALDLHISRTKGTELLQFLAAADCSARVVVISGSSQQVLSDACRFGSSLGLDMAGSISKPMRVADLRRRLQELRGAE